MDKLFIETRLNELTKEQGQIQNMLTQMQNNSQIIIGHINECRYWLKTFIEQEEKLAAAERALAEAQAPVSENVTTDELSPHDDCNHAPDAPCQAQAA